MEVEGHLSQADQRGVACVHQEHNERQTLQQVPYTELVGLKWVVEGYPCLMKEGN